MGAPNRTDVKRRPPPPTQPPKRARAKLTEITVASAARPPVLASAHDVMTDPTVEPDAPETHEPPDPLDVLADELLLPDAPSRIGALSREELLGLSSRVVGRARAEPDAEAAASLAVLHRGALLANQREILGLVLGGMAEVAEAMGDRPAVIEAYLGS